MRCFFLESALEKLKVNKIALEKLKRLTAFPVWIQSFEKRHYMESARFFDEEENANGAADLDDMIDLGEIRKAFNVSCTFNMDEKDLFL